MLKIRLRDVVEENETLVVEDCQRGNNNPVPRLHPLDISFFAPAYFGPYRRH